MTEAPKRHCLNVIGDFYVVDGCGLQCGIPRHIAPALFDEGNDSCFVRRQPATTEELELVIMAMRLQDLACVRYAGNDDNIRRRLAEAGVADKCDVRSR